MAIKENQTSQAGAQQQTGQGATFTEQAATAETVGQDLLARFSTQTKGLMARTPHSQVLSAYIESFKAQIAANNLGDVVKVIPLDQAILRTPFSVIAVVATLENDKNKVTGYYSLIVEETGDRLDTQIKKNDTPGLGFRELLIPRVAGDLVREDKFSPVVRAALAAELGVAPNALRELGNDVIPREAKAQDAVVSREIMQRAIAALEYQCRALLGDAAQYVVSFAEANKAGYELRTRVEINPAPAKTAAGLPVRSDLVAAVTLAHRQQNQHTSLMAGGSMRIAQLSAYMDLVYVGPRTIQAHQYAAPTETTQHYAMKMVITDTTVNAGITTPEYQLLALALAAEPLKTKSHYRVFQQHGMVDNLRDLDGLSAEMVDAKMLQPGMRVGTKDPAFDVGGFMRDFVHDVTRIVLHVPECGESTWIMSLLRDACSGSQTAIDAFFTAANNLTGGHFTAEFARLGGTTLGAISPQRVPLGYYINAQGVRDDIRQLDHLMVSNWVADKDLAKVYAWDDCFDPRKAPIDERLHAQIQYLKDYLGDIVITGYATEVEIFGTTLQALENALTKAGAALLPEYVFNESRAVPRNQIEWLNNGLSTSAFQQPGFAGPTFSQGGPTYQNKW